MQLFSLFILVMSLYVGSPSRGAAGDDQAAQRLRSAVEECRMATAAEPERAIQLFETQNALCFIGRFERGLGESLVYMLSNNDKVLVVKSPGGSGMEAARVGLHLLDKKIDVAVFDMCFSACANWVFLGGRRKYVAEETLLAWHGAPRRREPSAREKVLDIAWISILTYQLSDEFFYKARITKDLARSPNSANPDYPAWRARVNSTKTTYGWTWTRRSLEEFGVNGIVGYWHPDPATLRSLASARGIDLLVDQ